MKRPQKGSKKSFSKKTIKSKKNKKGGSRAKTFKKLNCSPGSLANNSTNTFTCFIDDSLLQLKTLWNKYYPNDQIKTNNIKTIWETFQKKMGPICNKESCWLKQPFANNKVDFKGFKQESGYTA